MFSTKSGLLNLYSEMKKNLLFFDMQNWIDFESTI